MDPMKVFNGSGSPVTVVNGDTQVVVEDLATADVTPSDHLTALLDAGHLVAASTPVPSTPAKTDKPSKET